jgi:dTDP-4-amino-4,6-dideoxygalactose transaminase
VTIPCFSLERQVLELHSELMEATNRVLSRSRFVLGEEVEAFEAEFASYLEISSCVGVASGTSAIELALRALGLGAGDEVLVPAFTAAFTALGVMAAGCNPVFVDVDQVTGNMLPAAAEAAIGPRTVAILVVHLYGRPADMDSFQRIASRHGLALVEDCAQAHGATWRGRKIGALGTLGCFSFYPTKNLGALGDAGAVVTFDANLADRVRRLRHGGQKARYRHVEFGVNARLDELQAAYLRIKLRHLDRWNQRRRHLAALYREKLSTSGLIIPHDPQEGETVYHIMAVRLDRRDFIARELARVGIGTDVHYPFALPDLPAFEGMKGSEVPNARLWARDEISLPMFPELTDDEVEEVCQAVVHTVESSRYL